MKALASRQALIAAGAGLLAAIVSGLIAGTVHAQQSAPAPDTVDFYAQRVQPILDDKCYSCHQDSQSGGLRLDNYSAILKGGKHGASIIPGDPEASLLVQAIRRTGELKMPPRHPLDDNEIATLVAWVKAGAKGTDSLPSQDADDDQTPAQTRTDQTTQTAQAAPAKKLVSAATAVIVPQGAISDEDFFENRVRPILATECLTCHSAGGSGGLKLDSREALLTGGNHGPAIVPGAPEKSLLITAIHQTTNLKMPKGGQLTAQQVADLVAWVKRGAVWPKSAPGIVISSTATTGLVTAQQRAFWAYQPLKPVPLPTLKNDRWAKTPAKTPIDRFILAKLLEAGLKPSPMADRRTLIRRATFDLWGLPPTQEEVDDFVRDKSPNAWDKVVDRLLASPRYGERWGRHWLDVARYAEDDVRGLDPKGRGYMPFEGAYRYRDWVIAAFNADLPYDQFLRLQLAGDQVPAKTQQEFDDHLTATSYLGAGPWVWDQAEPVQGRADERNERVDAVTRGLLGMTVACARCHNHKYDPIPQKDYYAMVGIFASSTYKEYPTVSPAETAAYKQSLARLERTEIELQDFTDTETKQLADALSLQTADYMQAAWNVLGKPKQTVEQAASKAKLDPEVLRRWTDYLSKPQQYDYLNDWNAMIADGSADQAKVLAEGFQKTLLAIREKARDIDEQNDIIRAKNDVPKHRIHDARPSEFETEDQFCPGCDLELKALPVDQAKLYSDIFVTRSGDQDTRFKPGVLVFKGWELTSRLGPQLQSYVAAEEDRIDALKKQVSPASYPFIHGMADKPKPVDIRLNIRGNPHSLGAPVPRRFLTVLSTSADPRPYTQGSGRLELANDIVASPLAARVLVNRIWKWHFGTGIVNTPDNFGFVGDEPSDPALLNYLAYEFVSSGYSIKKLQREILLSAVYQTSAVETPEAREKDGANRLYSHFTRTRLDAEQLRDSMLFVAGDLDWQKTSGPSKDFSADNTERTVYCKVSRYRLNNYLQVFDFPNPSFTSEQRFSSNVPLQQLYFMNNPFVFKQAGVLAQRVENAASDRDRIVQLYSWVYQRKPSEAEIRLALDFLNTTPEKAGYAVVGEPITAWRQYARILLSSNEFQFVD